MSKTILDNLGCFVEALQFEQLPQEVVDKANDCFFDFIGCYYAATKADDNAKILEAVADLNPREDVELWGTDRKCGIAEAALAIGCLGYHLEYDDGISLAGHWGSASIPATCLSALYHGKSGKDLLTAIVAAYEVGTRISRIFSPRLLSRHVHFPCTMGAFAAATGYAKAAGFSGGEIAGALSLAGLFPQGAYSTAISGAPGKGLYSGWPNYLGINVARFSRMGWHGDRDILENPNGFGTALGLSPVAPEDKEQILQDLGVKFRLMEVYFKPYPCNRWLHAPIAAIQHLIKEHHFDWQQISEIVVYGPTFIKMYSMQEGFDSKVTCQQSIPYCVGATAYFGRLGLEVFEEAARMDRKLHDLAKKIQVEEDAELQKKFPASYAVRVEIRLNDGTAFLKEQGNPWGPEKPPEKEELIEKFRSLTNGILSENQQNVWVSCYREGFENETSFEKVCVLLTEKI